MGRCGKVCQLDNNLEYTVEEWLESRGDKDREERGVQPKSETEDARLLREVVASVTSATRDPEGAEEAADKIEDGRDCKAYGWITDQYA